MALSGSPAADGTARMAPKLARRQVAALGAAALLAQRPARAQTPRIVRFGFASIGLNNRPFTGGSSAALAHAKGFVEQEFADTPDIRTEWIFFKGAGPAVNEAFANGQIDFASQGDLPQLIGRASGLKTTMVLSSGSHSPTYVGVPSASDIKSIKDLKGRKVAIFRGTNLHLTAVKVLAANGLSERDLQVINMDSATTAAALVANQVDAAFGTYELLNLARQGLASVIYDTKGDNPAFERHATILARDAFIAEHPDIAQRIVNALVRAAFWSSQEQNRDALFDVWANCGIPAAIFRDDFAGQALAYRNSPLLDPFLIAQYKQQAEDSRSYGLLRRPVDITGWFDPRFLDVALQQPGLRDAQRELWTAYGADGKKLSPA